MNTANNSNYITESDESKPHQPTAPPEHTPTPWYLDNHLSQIRDSNGNSLASLPYTLGDETDHANAAFIVRACNSYEFLLKALESIEMRASCAPNDDPEGADRELTRIMTIAQNAIKRAKGD